MTGHKEEQELDFLNDVGDSLKRQNDDKKSTYCKVMFGFIL